MRGLSIFAAASVLALAPAPAHAHDHAVKPDPVIGAVMAFMTHFNAKEAEAMKALTVDGAMVAVIEEREGDDRTRMVPLDTLITSISTATADIQEPLWDFSVQQDGPVASVSAKFELLVNGERSHCGTNVFSLIRVDDAWKIAGIAYSHIEEGCTGAPQE